MKIGRATGGVSAVGKPGTANQFQRRELVAVPVLRRYRPTGAKTVKHRDGVVTQNSGVMFVSLTQISPLGAFSCRGCLKFCDAKSPILWRSPGWAMRDSDRMCISPIRG